MNNNDKLLWVIIGLTVVILFAGFGGKSFVSKVADQVIEKLQKDYSPSPYGPGIDPDKLDVEKIRRTNPQPQPLQTGETNFGWESDWQR